MLQYSSFMFRNFRGDSPAEQRSGFALEAKEMQIVLSHGQALPAQGLSREVATQRPREFVCIDEFGKGTEDAHATALCAAVMCQMDKVRACCCMTHASSCTMYRGSNCNDTMVCLASDGEQLMRAASDASVLTRSRFGI